MRKKWWQEAVVYEIYCKSFCDSNGDGIGDLRGVMSKLHVLRDLGVNCIWFTPIYTSPQVDNGYDVADYRNIDPAYGTLEDFKELLAMAHGMGIRVIMDMVLNHSSDECEWFKESRKSKDNPYRDYYIWQPPKPDGSEPNNWGSYFRDGNGSAWEFDEATGEYYLHQYSIKMPDLNWEYEPFRREVYDMLNWWIDLGVDGFRLDVFTRFKKTAGFPDTKKPPSELDRNGFIVDQSMCTNVEGIHDIIHELYTEVFGPRDCMTVGEGAGVTHTNALDYINPQREELDMVYHFDLAYRGRLSITPELFRKVQKNWAEVMRHNAWPVQYLSNHDSARQVSCYGCDSERYRVPTAKLLGMLVHTTPGTPFIYQGEEIGMTNVKYDTIEDYNCCYTLGDYNAMIKSGISPKDAIDKLAPRSRDNARTPYQWDGTKNAGFSSGKPWLKVNPVYESINLKRDIESGEDSIFAFYRELIKMRREDPAIIDGNLEFILDGHTQIIAYLRRCARQTLLITVNYSGEETTLELPETLKNSKWVKRLSNFKHTPEVLGSISTLLPWEATIYELAR